MLEKISMQNFMSCIFRPATCIVMAQDKPEIKIGGALRYNYNMSSWKEGQKKRGGDFGYDVFRVNAKGAYKGIL
jgi:hypothetical protein